jgi:hypothetical protein
MVHQQQHEPLLLIIHQLNQQHQHKKKEAGAL